MNALPLLLEALQGALATGDPAASNTAEPASASRLPTDLSLFTIADYGAADGGTSQGLMRRAVEAVRAARGAGVGVSITYTDRPSNDFSALFEALLNPANEESPLRGNPDVYVFACGRSFYEPNFPPESIHLGFSATAMHWLTGVPCPLSQHVQAVGASPDEKAVFQAQAKKDWETILLHRGRELAKGGRLLLVNFCVDEQGRCLGNTEYQQSMFDVMNKLWKGMADEGLITQDEYRQTAFAQYYRTKEEFLAPLTDPTSPVASLRLKVDACMTDIVRCPYRQSFGNGEYDAVSYSHALVGTIRSWSEGVLLAGLNASRERQQSKELVDLFYERYRALVEASPTEHAMDYVHCYLLLHKEA